MFKGFSPIADIIQTWPSFIGQPNVLSEIGLGEASIIESGPEVGISASLIFLQTISLDFTLIDDFAILLEANGGLTEIDFQAFILPQFRLVFPNISFTFRFNCAFLTPMEEVNGAYRPKLLGNGAPEPVDIILDQIALEIDGDGNFDLVLPQGSPAITIPGRRSWQL